MSRAQSGEPKREFDEEERDLFERTAEALEEVDHEQAETARRILEIAAHSSTEEMSR
jgi:thymidylate kinase